MARPAVEPLIEHHRGAVDWSRAMLGEGSDAEVKALAKRIIDAQDAETAMMESLSPEG